MTSALALLLAAAAAPRLIELLSALLSLRTLRPDPPQVFAADLSPDDYAVTLAYVRATLRLALVEGTLSLSFILAFLAAGGLDLADRLARAAAAPLGSGEVLVGLVFLGMLGLLSALLDLPFAVYRTFVLETRFGFNRATPGLFVKDALLSLGLSVLLGGIVAAALLSLFQCAGQWAWVLTWIATSLFAVILLYVGPVLLLPLFNAFTPLPEGALRHSVEALAAKIGLTLDGIFLMDGSKRSAKSNAFFTGFGKKKRIALFDTLINQHPVEEITAVLAHEAGHQLLGHIPRSMVLSILKTGLVLFLFSLFLNRPDIMLAMGMANASTHAGLVLFYCCAGPFLLLAGMGGQALSRRREYAADAFAVSALGSPLPLFHALKRLGLANRSNLAPHPLAVLLHYSHPPLLARLTALTTQVPTPPLSNKANPS